MLADLNANWGSASRTGANSDAPLRCRALYEQLKALTRGQRITPAAMTAFIDGLDIPAAARAALRELTRRVTLASRPSWLALCGDRNSGLMDGRRLPRHPPHSA